MNQATTTTDNIFSLPAQPATVTDNVINLLEQAIQRRDEIVKEYARRFVEDGHQHGSLRDAANQTALDCIGLDEPFEIKKLFRQHVRQLQGRRN